MRDTELVSYRFHPMTHLFSIGQQCESAGIARFWLVGERQKAAPAIAQWTVRVCLEN